MSKIKNGGLDQYGAERFEQQQFRPAGVEWVNPASLQNYARFLRCGLDRRLNVRSTLASFHDQRNVYDHLAVRLACVALRCVVWVTVG